MSSIIYFDIRNFSTHVSYLSSNRQANTIFKVITDTFESLDNIIKKSRKFVEIPGDTFINHTGDGFVAIFYGKGKSLQSLYVASLLSKECLKILKEYKENFKKEIKVELPSLDFGIGIHLGEINRFEYTPRYPGNRQILGFFGNAINISYRVQESTKDHIFQIICTKHIYDNAIKLIKNEYKDNFIECFPKLEKHRLRGIEGHRTLYGVRTNFAEKIKPNMILNQQNKKQGLK
jgi:class 3 adenylate cyclase